MGMGFGRCGDIGDCLDDDMQAREFLGCHAAQIPRQDFAYRYASN
jgi:hypothetical protein